MTVVAPRDDYYECRHPQPGDVLLIVEVADTTHAYDRNDKVPLYARHAVSEVWVVDLEKRRIECYSVPSGGTFTKRCEVSPGEPLSLSALGGVRVDFTL